MGAYLFGAASKDNEILDVAVPSFVTNYQARRALIDAGLFDTVDSMIQSLSKNSPEYQSWEYANFVYRESEIITTLGQQLGLTVAQIDNLFVEANKIQ